MGLDVLHPWFLTGTPVVNSLKDLGPALRFIGAMDYDDFNSRVGRIEKSVSGFCRRQIVPLNLACRASCMLHTRASLTF